MQRKNEDETARSNEEELAVAELTAHLTEKVRLARASWRDGLAEAKAMLAELRSRRESRLHPYLPLLTDLGRVRLFARWEIRR
jgi:hypothetical protein